MDRKKLNKINKLKEERNNCPHCNSNQYKVTYKGKPKKRGRYFTRLECLICGLSYIAESESEFKERLKD